jgi:hypothetical protein
MTENLINLLHLNYFYNLKVDIHNYLLNKIFLITFQIQNILKYILKFLKMDLKLLLFIEKLLYFLVYLTQI